MEEMPEFKKKEKDAPAPAPEPEEETDVEENFKKYFLCRNA